MHQDQGSKVGRFLRNRGVSTSPCSARPEASPYLPGRAPQRRTTEVCRMSADEAPAPIVHAPDGRW